mmetsp:Transcript_7524/g.11071  ORF Transcript_7524/g.11071 Transcript_7524/m.11071 type:complete len:113 (-) Transcript_7524:719-1057(-)
MLGARETRNTLSELGHSNHPTPSLCVHGQPLIPTVEELEDEDEKVDDVEVELDGRQDVVIRPHLVVYHVCVEDNVERKDDGAGNAIAIVQVGSRAKQHHAKSEEAQHHGTHK